jgi:hypothetical protein
MKNKVFKWIDSYKLTKEEVKDFDYLENIITSYEDRYGELEEEDVINLICDYQIYFKKKIKE